MFPNYDKAIECNRGRSELIQLLLIANKEKLLTFCTQTPPWSQTSEKMFDTVNGLKMRVAEGDVGVRQNVRSLGWTVLACKVLIIPHCITCITKNVLIPVLRAHKRVSK